MKYYYIIFSFILAANNIIINGKNNKTRNKNMEKFKRFLKELKEYYLLPIILMIISISGFICVIIINVTGYLAIMSIIFITLEILVNAYFFRKIYKELECITSE